MRQPIIRIAYKYYINVAKTEFPYYRCVVIIGKYKTEVIPIILYIVYAARPPSDYEKITSVFYDVVRFEFVRGRSNVFIEGDL